MKSLFKFALSLGAALALTGAASAHDHDHGHGRYWGHGAYYGRGYYHGGVLFGVGFYPGYWGPYGYPYPYDYPPPYYGTYQGRVVDDSHESLEAAVEQALAKKGYYHGDIDGVIGPMARQAIRDYQRDNGLAVTGRINNGLLGSLDLD